MWKLEIIRIIVLIVYIAIASVMDIIYKSINFIYILFGFLIMFILYIYAPFDFFSLIVGITFGIILIIVAILTKEAIGIADGLVICIIGIGVGMETIYICMYSLMFISIFTIFLLISKKNVKKFEIPMIPFYFVSLIFQVVYVTKVI